MKANRLVPLSFLSPDVRYQRGCKWDPDNLNTKYSIKNRRVVKDHSYKYGFNRIFQKHLFSFSLSSFTKSLPDIFDFIVHKNSTVYNYCCVKQFTRITVQWFNTARSSNNSFVNNSSHIYGDRSKRWFLNLEFWVNIP